MTIDNALELYIEKLNNNENIDLEFFKKNLSKEDYEEFLELIPVINICKSKKETEEFEKMFTEINSYKNEIYGKQQVSNFRADKNSSEDESEEILDKIFDEEFNNE